MTLLDRRQDAWPSIAAPATPVPGRDEKRLAEFSVHPAAAAVAAKFGTDGLSLEEYVGQVRLVVPRARLLEILSFLKTDAALEFDYLMDVVGADYLHFRGARHRYAVTYSLLSHRHNKRLWVRVWLDDGDLRLPTVYDLWNGADWLEREVYDMFGIVFDGHPDLRRVLLPKDFRDHPLRKDYPLTGKGERHDFLTVDRDTA